jgi:two-component system cell cycle sensor histidine kinase/response regulator CckA
MLRRLIGEDVEVRLVTPDVGAVKLDRCQFEQVIVNLAVNARDAMDKGGRLTIALRDARHVQPLSCDTGVLPPGRYAAVEVADTGHGIAPEVLGHIFEPFFTTKGPGRGTGLGLSTVYGIVTEAGGAIAIDTEQGRGTTFTVYLPLVEEGAVAPSAAGPTVVRAACGGTVLVVEDEELLARSCQRILESAGYRVVKASSGMDAVKIVLSNPAVDLVLTDVVMPAGNGPESVEAMRLHRPDLKVLFMSGYGQHPVLKAPVPLTSDPLLQKPFSTAQLLASVATLLGATESRPAATR